VTLGTWTVADSSPVIRGNVTVQRGSGTSFNVIVEGYSTSRELSNANLIFNGVNVDPTPINVPLTAASAVWFSTGESGKTGGNYRLTIPFTTNLNLPTGSVSVRLTNRVGQGSASSGSY